MQVRVAFAVLCLAALCSSTARAAWQCRTINKSEAENSETQKKVKKLCAGLQNALDFWVSGHEGHYPKKDRQAGFAAMTRLLCQDTAGDQAVGGVQNDNLELYCLDRTLRGGGDNAVQALNAVLAAAGVNDHQVTWISSSDPNTQNFYKSLDVSCSCDSDGKPGKEVRLMKFTAAPGKQPIQKKQQHFREGQGRYIHRILFDICMSTDDFDHIAEQLSEQGVSIDREVRHLLKGDEPVHLSELIDRGVLDVGDKKKWRKEHLTTCE